MEQEKEEGDLQLVPVYLGQRRDLGIVGGKSNFDINPIIFIAKKIRDLVEFYIFIYRFIDCSPVRFITERSKVMWMFGDKCSPISKWLFLCSTVTSELFSCLLKSTPISQKHLVQNQKYTAVQDILIQ